MCFSTAQGNGPWRHKIKWETNGQVYSLLGSGSQYHTPVSGKHTRFLLTRHMMPTGRIFMGRFANGMHTVGHVVHSEHSPGMDARHYMMSGRTSPMKNNQLSLNEKRSALSSDEALRTSTKKPTLAPVKASRAPGGHHNILTKTPQRTSPTINIEENPLTLLSTSTGSKTANNSKLPSRTNSASPSAYVNNRHTENSRLQVEERGGETIGVEPTNPHINSRNSFYFNMLPNRSANRFPHRETGQGTRYFHNGKTTF